jgi:hypothetical protein
MPDMDSFYRRLIEQAKGGDRDDALALLREFALSVLHTDEVAAPLMMYVAQSISDWLASECDPKQAAKAFNVQRPRHRPMSGTTAQKIAHKHIKAWRTYYLMRARGKGYDEAKYIAASNAGLSISMVKKLVEGSLDTELSKEERTVTVWNTRTGEVTEEPLSTVLSKGLTVEQATALFGIKNLKVRARCLNVSRIGDKRSR